MKKIIILFALVFSGLTYAQTTTPVSKGMTYFNNKDYFNASLEFEKESKTNPNAYLNLAKSYFGLKKFNEALEALKMYKAQGSNINTNNVNEFLALLERMDDDAIS